MLADTVDALATCSTRAAASTCTASAAAAAPRPSPPAYLAETRGWSGRRALAAVADCLPEVAPNATFLTWLDGVPGDGA